MKKNIYAALFLLCVSTTAFAGKATFSGEARVKAEADFVELKITVSSECFKTAVSAVSDNDVLANQIIELLGDILSTSDLGTKIFASGGYVERYTGYEPATRRTFCKNTFRKNNLITVRTKLSSTFAKDFARIQDSVLRLAREPSAEPHEIPISFLQMSQPVPGLDDQHRDELHAQAVSLAMANAVEKFRATFPLLGIDRYTISSYRESGTIRTPIRGGRGADLISAPVNFDELSVSSNVIVEFAY